MTSSEGRTDSSFVTLSCRVSTRLHHVLSPVDQNFLRNLLILLKYVPSGPAQPSLEGIEIITGPRIATRESVSIEFNPDKQVILAAGREVQSTVLAFEELIGAIRKQLGAKALKTWFFEVTLQGLGEGQRSPIDTFGSVENAMPKAKELDSIFGDKLSLFGMRLAPTSRPVDATNWFEYRIEPYVPQADAKYVVITVYRHEQFGEVKSYAFNLEAKTKAVIAALEAKAKQEKLD